MSYVIITLTYIINTLSGHFNNGKCIIDEVYVIIGAIILGLITYSHLIICVSEHMTNVLGIRIFSLEKRTPLNRVSKNEKLEESDSL